MNATTSPTPATPATPPPDAQSFARDARRLDFIMKHVWPLLRPVLGRGLSRRCRRCILPESHSGLNADGLCPLCAAAPPLAAHSGAQPTSTAPIQTGHNPIDDLLAASAGRANGPYDAMLLLSGGKDSAFLLDRLRREHPKLRLLTAMVNNGFMSPIAHQNADRLRRHMGVDYVELCPDAAFVRRAFAYALTHLEHQTGYSIVDSLDGQITFDTAQNRAAAWGIPLVIAGMSKTQIEMGFGDIGWEFPSDRLEWIAPGLCRNDIDPDPQGHHWYRPECWPSERRPRFILPFVVWNPTETFIVQEVTQRGLLDPSQTAPLLTNNSLIPIITFAEIARKGYCCFEVEFANMVREGKSSRADWLSVFQVTEYAAKTGAFLGPSITNTLTALGLTPAALGIGVKRSN